MFYGTPSVYLWEDSDGVVHSIPQEAGGEQGDTMMPLLFSVGTAPRLGGGQQKSP